MTYQLPSAGLHTTKSVMPSPSKSPATGMSPGKPHCCVYGCVGRELGMMYQVPLAGRHTTKSVLSSPSKSTRGGKCISGGGNGFSGSKPTDFVWTIRVAIVLLGSVLFPLLASWRKNIVPSLTHSPVVAAPFGPPVASSAPAGAANLTSTFVAGDAFHAKWAIPKVFPV